MQSLFTTTTDFMYSLRGLPGCGMDFVSLHYQFSNIEFYEANTIQREANIKNACMRFKSNVTVQLLSSFQPSRLYCWCARTYFRCWDCFLALFPLVAVDGTALTSQETVPCCSQRCKPWFTLHRFFFFFPLPASLLLISLCVHACVTQTNKNLE